MDKKYSGRRRMVQMFIAMVMTTILCVLICGGYTIYSTQKELQYCGEAALDVYELSIEQMMQDLTSFAETIYSEDSDFRTLALGTSNVSAQAYLQAELTMRRMIRARITANTGILVFSSDNKKKYYSVGEEFFPDGASADAVKTMDLIRGYWLGEGNPNFRGWIPLESYLPGRDCILMQTRRYKSYYICVMVNLSSFAASGKTEANTPITYAFFTNDQILTNEEYAEKNAISVGDMLAASDSEFHVAGMQHILQSRIDPESGLGVCAMIATSDMWGHLRIFLSLLMFALLVICLVFYIIFNGAQRMLLMPLDKITEASRRIAGGETEICWTPERIQEVDDIQTALVTLVEQKVHLESERSREEAQKDHAMLQYYQLQTKSHFMLNCLKSIYNLISRGEREGTMRVITRFSNHIRYVFHDSLTLVPVEAELKEVDDYFEIIGLEREDHILLTKKVDPALMDFPIPPLLIQTFVENFQKHNVQSDCVLKFSIRIDMVELEEQRYVRIRMSDNGIGYSEEALEQLQNPEDGFAQFHVGIQNLCRRIDILYKGRQQIAFFNLPGGGACSVFYLPFEACDGEKI